MKNSVSLVALWSILALSSVALGQTSHAFLWTAAGGMQDLGVLRGWQRGSGEAINEVGQVVGGDSQDNGLTTCFGWSKVTGITALKGLSVSDCFASGINDAGQVVGTNLMSDGSVRGYLWAKNDELLDLGDLGSGASVAVAINKSGSVVGYSQNASDVIRPFIWTQAAGMQDLISLTANCPTCNGVATSISDSGVIVGDIATKPDGDVTAFTWKNGHVRFLGVLGGRRGSMGSVALGINNVGQVVGFSTVASGAPHPFLWTNSGGMQDLGLLPNFAECFAYGINDSTQVVGYCVSEQTTRAFLWTAATGIQDIGTLGGGSAEAIAINNAGQVTGWAETQ